MAKEHMLRVRADAEFLATLRTAAAREKRSMSNFIRIAVLERAEMGPDSGEEGKSVTQSAPEYSWVDAYFA